MEFIEFRDKLKEHIDSILAAPSALFTVNADKDFLYNLYLNSFPAGTNEVFRERRAHDCSACKHFIRAFGNVVVIEDRKIKTIWDFTAGDETYDPVLASLDTYIRSCGIEGVFLTNQRQYGLMHNTEELDDGRSLTWHHFYYVLPKKFVLTHCDQKDLNTKKSQIHDTKNVFKRSLEEISEDAVLTVLELISQGSLYRGEEWDALLRKFLEYHRFYKGIPEEEKDLYCWEMAPAVGEAAGRIRNHAIGTLLTNITEGVRELDEVVREYENIVAPTNYKRPKPIYSQKMLELAQKEVETLGFMDSLPRRFATLDDITVNNILFANRDAAKLLSGNVFEQMQNDLPVNPRNFSRLEECPVETFINEVLPDVRNMEALFENRHGGNLVSLIAPKNKDSKTMFKWDNNFSWAYKGNIADSMKERVKAAGGNIEGVLRFSIQWNDSEYNPNDFDAHCIEPDRNDIYFRDKVSHRTGGNLDVDIIHPDERKVAVENITFPYIQHMVEGDYRFFVHCYSNRGGRAGFQAEIEFDGQIYSFSYNKELRQDEIVDVATVNYSRADGFKIVKSMDSSFSTREIWGLKTNQFYPVTVAMSSPNYWNEQEGIGNKHYFLMLKGCQNPERPNGFFNEYLNNALSPHRKVFEALGGIMKAEDSQDQLSGLGFSSTQRNSLICSVEGRVSRKLKILF